MNIQHIGLVGYGEVGKIFSTGLQSHAAQVSAWDLLFDPEATPVRPRDAALAHAAQAGVQACASLQALCESGVDCIISAVTASSTLAVAQAAAESGVATRPIADLDAYRQQLTRYVYQTGILMRPVINAAKAITSS